jgi:hemolysin-activating ACP:hemolysin acyltransferase
LYIDRNPNSNDEEKEKSIQEREEKSMESGQNEWIWQNLCPFGWGKSMNASIKTWKALPRE